MFSPAPINQNTEREIHFLVRYFGFRLIELLFGSRYLAISYRNLLFSRPPLSFKIAIKPTKFYDLLIYIFLTL